MVKCYQKDYPRPQFVREEWFSLDGKWRLDYWPQGDTPIVSPADARQVEMKTIDATVPGNVELDLLAAGLIGFFALRRLRGRRAE